MTPRPDSLLLPRPRAVLLDLDDTIVEFDGGSDLAWREVCGRAAETIPGLDARALLEAVFRMRDWLWDDPERHRHGRADLVAAGTAIVAQALTGLGHDEEPARGISLEYRALRDAQLAILPGAKETLDWLRAEGFGTALVTNGAQRDQQAKIERFDLARHFDLIWIEGERGVGKPEIETYFGVLEGLALAPSDAWFVGDNIEWDVLGPQSLGMQGVWVSASEEPPPAGVQPDATIAAVGELRALLTTGGG